MNKMRHIICHNCLNEVKYNEQPHCPSCNAYLFGYKSIDEYKFCNNKKENVEPQVEVNNNLIGWLIIHDEGKDVKQYKLKEGIMIIGRSSENFNPDISIDEDNLISRYHALLTIKKQLDRYICTIVDKHKDKGSLNGTYINGDTRRLNQDLSYILKNGDTIQIGETKLVYISGVNANNNDEALTRIEEIPYMHTVLINDWLPCKK